MQWTNSGEACQQREKFRMWTLWVKIPLVTSIKISQEDQTYCWDEQRIHAISWNTSWTRKKIICKICPVPFKFSKNSNLKQHNVIKHNIRNDQIKYGKNVRMLSEEYVCIHELKVATSEIFLEVLTWKQNLKVHLKDAH